MADSFATAPTGKNRPFLIGKQAVMNHERAVTTLAKALVRIADVLPRVKLATVLYPTDQMQAAVNELYKHLLCFFTRAHDWYHESTLHHIIHSITQPVELRYADILDKIGECSKSIDQITLSGSQAELRDMHKKLDVVLTRLERSDANVQDMANQMIGESVKQR